MHPHCIIKLNTQNANQMVADENGLLFSGGLEYNCLNNISDNKSSDENNELSIIRRSSYVITLINLNY